LNYAYDFAVKNETLFLTIVPANKGFDFGKFKLEFTRLLPVVEIDLEEQARIEKEQELDQLDLSSLRKEAVTV
jgi:hypothetical protein